MSRLRSQVDAIRAELARRNKEQTALRSFEFRFVFHTHVQPTDPRHGKWRVAPDPHDVVNAAVEMFASTEHTFEALVSQFEKESNALILSIRVDNGPYRPQPTEE